MPLLGKALALICATAGDVEGRLTLTLKSNEKGNSSGSSSERAECKPLTDKLCSTAKLGRKRTSGEHAKPEQVTAYEKAIEDLMVHPTDPKKQAAVYPALLNMCCTGASGNDDTGAGAGAGADGSGDKSSASC